MIAAGRTGRRPDRASTITAVRPRARRQPIRLSGTSGRSRGCRRNRHHGPGIVEVFAKSGYDVVFVARSDEKVAGVRAAVTKSLDKAVAKAKMTEDVRNEVLGRITGATQREALADVDLVVEAIVEDLEVKPDLFRDLTASASRCHSGHDHFVAARRGDGRGHLRPQDVVGMHFFNPAPIMKLVEVVSPLTTGKDVTDTVVDPCAKVGKHPVKCGDRAGFIVNALLFPYLNDAVLLLESHYATADEIDTVMTKGAGLPLGPSALLDVVGNDVSLAIEQTLHSEFRLPELVPARLLEQMVEAGYLGRKTGWGFARTADRLPTLDR